MRKTYVTVTVKLLINADEGVDINEFLNEMDYSFKSATEGADIVDSSIEDTEITDSK